MLPGLGYRATLRLPFCPSFAFNLRYESTATPTKLKSQFDAQFRRLRLFGRRCAELNYVTCSGQGHTHCTNLRATTDSVSVFTYYSERFIPPKKCLQIVSLIIQTQRPTDTMMNHTLLLLPFAQSPLKPTSTTAPHAAPLELMRTKKGSNEFRKLNVAAFSKAPKLSISWSRPRILVECLVLLAAEQEDADSWG